MSSMLDLDEWRNRRREMEVRALIAIYTPHGVPHEVFGSLDAVQQHRITTAVTLDAHERLELDPGDGNAWLLLRRAETLHALYLVAYPCWMPIPPPPPTTMAH